MGNLEASQTPSPLLRIRAGIEVPATVTKSDSFALESNQNKSNISAHVKLRSERRHATAE